MEIHSFIVFCIYFHLALFPYTASGRFEVSLEIGEKLKLDEETNGWFRGASISSATSKKGIFPANYVKYADTIQELEMDTDILLMEIQKTFKNWQFELQKSLDVRIPIFYHIYTF
jgi:hypothetical protein